MDLFDAVNHALITVSTGGYSTRSDSVAAFDSAAIEPFVAAGMVLSGANFALYYFLGDRVTPERLRLAFLGFFFIYITALAAGTLLMALHGLPLGQSFGSVFSCLNITGTALGPVGDLPATAKFVLTGYMLLGRLELFTCSFFSRPGSGAASGAPQRGSSAGAPRSGRP